MRRPAMQLRDLPALLMIVVLLLQPHSGIAAGDGKAAAAVPPRLLLITVLQTADADAARELLFGHAGNSRDASGGSWQRVYRTHGYRDSTRFEQLRVLEGQAAFLQVGRVVPEVRLLWVKDVARGPVPNIGFSERVSMQGFQVRAVLEGDMAKVQIQQSGGWSQPGFGHADSQQVLMTTLSGRPGEWLDLGGTLELADTVAAEKTYEIRRRRPGETRVLVRVELAN